MVVVAVFGVAHAHADAFDAVIAAGGTTSRSRRKIPKCSRRNFVKASVMRVSATGEIQLTWMLYDLSSLAAFLVNAMTPPLAAA